MSLDNYLVIKKSEDKFIVSEGYSSDESHRAVELGKFTTLFEAKHFAEERQNEYGVQIDDNCL